MTTWKKAFSLYKQYKTETQQYKQFAASHGYTTGELNAHFASQLYAESK